MRGRPLSGLMVLALAFMAASCDSPSLPMVCTDELRVSVTPADTTIRIGESFTARVSLSTCADRVRLVDTLTFTSFDTGVATVEPVTGVVMGKAPGVAGIQISGKRYHRLGGLYVTVVVPGP